MVAIPKSKKMNVIKTSEEREIAIALGVNIVSGADLDQETKAWVNGEYDKRQATTEGWVGRFWDIFENLYWDTKYIGLESNKISNDLMRTVVRSGTFRDNDSLPRQVYYRVANSREHWKRMISLEEPFNHIFNLTFAILSEPIISKFFAPLCKREKLPPLRILGRSLPEHFGWNRMANITSPDAYFVGEGIVLAIENKFHSKTSAEQVAKYIYLLMNEEKLQREKVKDPEAKIQMHLMFIFNKDPKIQFSSDVGVLPDKLDLELLLGSLRDGNIKRYFEADTDRTVDTLKRVNIHMYNWHDFAKGLHDFEAKLVQDVNTSTDAATVINLLDGLQAAIMAHTNSGVPKTGFLPRLSAH